MTTTAQSEASQTTADSRTPTSSAGVRRATIYDRIGGASAIAAAVNNFYPRLLADPDLADYFAGTDLTRLQRHQRAFLAAALGGPALYAGRDLATAHAHLRIDTASFDKVAGHLVDTLVELNVDSDVITDVVATVAPLRDVVCHA